MTNIEQIQRKESVVKIKNIGTFLLFLAVFIGTVGGAATGQEPQSRIDFSGAAGQTGEGTSDPLLGCDPINDSDCDGVVNGIDNCLFIFNSDQSDLDADGQGDVCDVDDDNDGILDQAGLGVICPTADTCDASKTCSLSGNECADDTECVAGSQSDPCVILFQVCLNSGEACTTNDDCPPLTDTCDFHCGDSGAACDPGNDNCSVTGCDDNCAAIANPTQTDTESDGVGDACDNCAAVANPDQANVDAGSGDTLGDVCDPDIDNDLFFQDESINPVCSVIPDSNGQPPGPPNTDCRDNCPFDHNESQWDHDGDLVGSVCDNCSTVANVDQIDADNDQLGNVCDNCVNDANGSQENEDDDAVGDECDNCSDDANNGQVDRDFDGLGDVCDDCPGEFDPGQADRDEDNIGDVCDPCPDDAGGGDVDGDLICNSLDNCPGVPNVDQSDIDGDGDGDVCDCDRDGDGVNDKLVRTTGIFNAGFFFVPINEICYEPACQNNLAFLATFGVSLACGGPGGQTLPCCVDNCPDLPNALQSNTDGDNDGNACDPNPAPEPGPSTNFDSDGDSAADAVDNCPSIFNSDQADLDLDAQGDACDADADDDAALDAADNCQLLFNPDQSDLDADGVGDSCDNCPLDANPNQIDSNADLTGDRCDVADGKLALHFDARDTLAWEQEVGFDEWITVSGDLTLLRLGAGYLQDPEAIPLASVQCGGTGIWSVEHVAPEPGESAFFLVGGATGIFENGFGVRPDGTRRIAADVCP